MSGMEVVHGDGCAASHAGGKSGDLAQCDRFLDEQHGDAVVDAIGELAIARHQRFAQRIALRRPSARWMPPAAIAPIQCAKAARLQQRQRLARGGAGEDVEQLAIHGGHPIPRRVRRPVEYVFATGDDHGRQPDTSPATPAPLVGLVMGSRSDWDTMQHAAAMLDALGVPHEVRVVSAHRTPDVLFEYAASAQSRGLRAIIAGAGGAAHLPGMLAAKTAVPVLGVPVQSQGARRHGFAAVDRADAGRHSGGDVRDRQCGRSERRAVRRRDAGRATTPAIAAALAAFRARQTADVRGQRRSAQLTPRDALRTTR